MPPVIRGNTPPVIITPPATTSSTVTAPGSAPVTTPAPATPAQPAATFGGTTTVNPGAPVPVAGGAAGGVSAFNTRLLALAGNVDPAMMAALSTPQGMKATVEKLSAALVQSNGAVITPQQEKQIFETLARLQLAGQLHPALELMATQAQAGGALPANMPPEKKAALVTQFEGMIGAEIAARGAAGTQAGVFESWEQASAKMLTQVRDTAVPARGPGSPSAFTDARFVAEFEKLTGARFTDGNSVTPLINGPASFKERDRMIDGAQKSIHVLTWAFYDDDTGMETAKKLIEKKKQGVDVKVMVDGNVARQPGHGGALKLMEDAGIPVIRWNDPQRVHDGQHRKVMIVDGKEAVGGGLNQGNVYSHRGPATDQKWRDTDVLMRGPCVKDSEKLFVSLWNEQVRAHHLPHGQLRTTPVPPTSGEARVSVVNDTPGPRGTSGALLAALKAIEGATERVDIENAYFISTPALKEAIEKALERGVKVRIMTNSAESVDEPIVSAPILQSLPGLVEKGAEVYLKQGDTLHSKFLVVDGMYSGLGSYNLHPRSERYEGEVLFNTLSQDTAKALTTAFEADIAGARRIATPADVQVPVTPMSVLASRLFFDQL